MRGSPQTNRQDEVIRSRANARAKLLRQAFAEPARLAGSLVAIEGEHLLEEAAAASIAIHSIYLNEDRPLWSGLPRDVETVRLANDVFSSCVETRAPQGVAALVVPRAATLAHMLVGVPLLVVAAGLQDPGNLGTLIRSALAFGATGVLTTPGTVSPWNGKALRASAGAAFRMPLMMTDADTCTALRRAGVRLLAAVKEDARSASTLDLTVPCAIAVGNEGAGLDAQWLAAADARVTIPCPGPVESLNAGVAGSLLLYEAARQRSAAAPGPGA